MTEIFTRPWLGKLSRCWKSSWVACCGPTQIQEKLYCRNQFRDLCSQHATTPPQSIQRCGGFQASAQTRLKIIFGDAYINYESALTKAGLQNLDYRRNSLCLKFAKNCIKNNNTKHMFPVRDNYTNAEKKFPEVYQVQHANTDRLKKSPLIFINA